MGQQYRITHLSFDRPALKTSILGALLMTGCATVQKVLPTTAWREARARNDGYILLYQLLRQESDVNKLLFLKPVDVPLAEQGTMLHDRVMEFLRY
jgi:hypothetical protein